MNNIFKVVVYFNYLHPSFHGDGKLDWYRESSESTYNVLAENDVDARAIAVEKCVIEINAMYSKKKNIWYNGESVECQVDFCTIVKICELS